MLFSPFQIANYAFFATSLCDLLYNFEEFCSIREKLFSKEFIPLRKAIDSFHNVVVLSLNKVLMIKEKVKKEYSSKKTPQVQMPLQRSPNKSKLPATFRQVQETLRSPGYLLPQKLDGVKFCPIQRRRQVVSTRLVRNDSGVAKRSAPTHESAKNIEDRRVQHLARGITEKVMDEIVSYTSSCLARRRFKT
ncbi:unnamed protein product [Thelazia callipaeda]|uniref:Centromere protein T n=1 Tax=Thelazia callipaeda TaxID=103827 RepID=A0A0N5CSZ8_THECL|nr:unnamed protein product [Thelazia callipaeda]